MREFLHKKRQCSCCLINGATEKGRVEVGWRGNKGSWSLEEWVAWVNSEESLRTNDKSCEAETDWEKDEWTSALIERSTGSS